VTPNFDEIFNNGISFTNAYASGTRSVYGMASTTVGASMMPGMLVFSEGGLEMNNVVSVPEMFNEKGYITMFTQPTPKASQLTHNVYKNVFHFQETYGQEDMPLKLPYLQKIYFGYDYELLDFINEKAAQYSEKGKPFFIYTYTGTSHMPFLPTTKDFDKYPTDTPEHKFLNNLYYTDYALGNFIEKAKKEKYFDNTIFFFIADHTTLTGAGDSLKTRFNIPFVIYAPKLFKPRKIDWTVSQADVIPTLYKMLNIGEPYTANGKNALDGATRHFAIMNDGLNIGYVEGDNFMVHNRNAPVESSAQKGTPEFEELETSLLSLDKAITESFRFNKWYKKTENN